MECVECRQGRKRRCSILSTDADNQASFQQVPFTETPFVHHFRYPSGHAQQLWAIEFAKSRKQRVLWFVAYDKPNVKESLKLRGERGGTAQRRVADASKRMSPGTPEARALECISHSSLHCSPRSPRSFKFSFTLGLSYATNHRTRCLRLFANSIAGVAAHALIDT